MFATWFIGNVRDHDHMSHPIDILVGKRIRTRRAQLEMTQSDLADRLGITFQQVQKYEKGVNRVGASRLYAIAQVLGVSIEYFFIEPSYADNHKVIAHIGPPPSESTSEMTEFLHSEQSLRLLKSFNRISDSGVRTGILSLVQSLSGKNDH